jgi:hypothetical protein
MSTDRRSEQPAGAGESGPPDQPSDAEDPKRAAEAGAESYGGDEDAGPSVTDEEIDTGLERDQAEG